uniref:Uncharacterized protein n=1 Tax=Trichobilharzia regenti TaxID=157069 RepID=A0AA85K2W0_TRIRE|nr:unnamed protein product [Trichobilharzia regenti]
MQIINWYFADIMNYTMSYSDDSVVTTSTITNIPITQDNQFYEDAVLYEYNQHNSEIGISLSLQRKVKKTDGKIIRKATHLDDNIQDGKSEHEVIPQNNLNQQLNVSPTAITTANSTALSMPENLSTNQPYSKDDINPGELSKQTYSVVIFRTESINDVVTSLNSSLPEIDYNNSTKDLTVNRLGERDKKRLLKSMAKSQKVDKKAKSHLTPYNDSSGYEVIQLTTQNETLSSFKTIPITYSIKPNFTLINNNDKWSNINHCPSSSSGSSKSKECETRNDRLEESETNVPIIDIITEPIVAVFEPTELQIKIYSPQQSDHHEYRKEKTTTFPPNLTSSFHPEYISASTVTASEGDELPHRTNSIEQALQDTSQKSSENRSKRLYLKPGRKSRTLKKHAYKGVNHAPLKTTPMGSRTKSPSCRKIMTNYSPTKSPHKRSNNSPKNNYQPLTRLSNKTVRQQPKDKSIRSQTISPTLRYTPLKSVNSLKRINCERKRRKSAPNESLSTHSPPASIRKLMRTDDKQNIYEASVHLIERINKRLKKYKQYKSLHQQSHYKRQTTMSPTLRRGVRSKPTEMKTRIKSPKMKYNELNSKDFNFRRTNRNQITRSNTSSLSESISQKQLKYKDSPITAIRKLRNRDNASNSTSMTSLLENQCYNLPMRISKSDYRLTSPGIL